MREEHSRRSALKILGGAIVGAGTASERGSAAQASSTAGPTARISYSPSTPHPDEEVTLDGTGSTGGDGNIEDYRWTIQTSGGYVVPKYTAKPTHSWDTGGSFSVSLEVTDSNGNSSTTSKTVTVVNDQPSADFSVSPSQPVPDEIVTLDGTLSSDPDGSIEDYRWTIQTSGGYVVPKYTAKPTHSWESGGTYSIKLEVTDNGEKTDTISKEVKVGNPGPTAEFSVSPREPVPDQTVTLDGTLSSDPDGSIEEYNWTIQTSDGYVVPKYSQKPTYSWESGGTYTVELEVTDNGGKTATVKKEITVSNTEPVAEFTYSPSVPEPNEAVTLDGTASSDSDGSIEDYNWTIQTSDGYTIPKYTQKPTYSWESGGTYTVELEVTDNGGEKSSVSKQIAIGNSRPMAKFSQDPPAPGVGDRVTFDASDSTDPEENIDTFDWSIDGTSKSGKRVEHVFDERGEVAVELTVTDTRGASNTRRQTFFVGNQSPAASISYTPLQVVADTTITFDAGDSSDPDGEIAEYRWSFPGGETRTGSLVEYRFTTAGEQEVTLEVVDDEGQTATETVSVTVDPSSTSATSVVGSSPEKESGVNANGQQTTAIVSGPDNQDSSTGNSPVEDGLLPALMGVLGVGGAGTLLYLRRRSGSERPEPMPTAPPAELLADADQARAEGEYSTAVQLYEQCLEQLETGSVSGEPTATKGVAGGAALSVATVRERLHETRELELLDESLQSGITHLQTAISEHAQKSVVAATAEYRKAREQFDDALGTIEDSANELFDEGITVESASSTDSLPNSLDEWPNMPQEAIESLRTEGIETRADLQASEEETIATLERRELIDSGVADRLRAARWWIEENEYTFSSSEEVATQRSRANEGVQMGL